MWLERKLVMLPTNEKANKGDIIGNDKGFIIADISYSLTELSFIQAKVYKLYILSDEEIKEGDWVLDTVSNKVLKSDHDVDYEQNHAFKIIATTDKSLMIGFSNKELNSDYLPQIHQLFIEHFVCEYNKGNVITKVMVEYERFKRTKLNGSKIDCGDIKLKINPDNTINIKPIKDSWSKNDSDLIKAFEKFACAVYDANFNKDTSIRQRAEIMSKKWIEENL